MHTFCQTWTIWFSTATQIYMFVTDKMYTQNFSAEVLQTIFMIVVLVCNKTKKKQLNLYTGLYLHSGLTDLQYY